MAEAVRAVLEGRMGFQKAANAHGVPKGTLERKMRKARSNNLQPKTAAVEKLSR